MPARLIDTQNLLIRTGQRDVPEIIDMLDEMSLAGTIYLEGELRTKFDVVSGVADIFDIGEALRYQKPYTPISLSNGFIDMPSVVVETGLTLQELEQSPTLLPPTEYLVKSDGLLMLLSAAQPQGQRYASTYHNYCKVRYSCGIPSDGVTYDQTVVPEWLKEILTQYVIFRVNNAAPFKKTSKSNASSAKETILLQSMLNSYARLHPQAIKPIF